MSGTIDSARNLRKVERRVEHNEKFASAAGTTCSYTNHLCYLDCEKEVSIAIRYLFGECKILPIMLPRVDALSNPLGRALEHNHGLSGRSLQILS